MAFLNLSAGYVTVSVMLSWKGWPCHFNGTYSTVAVCGWHPRQQKCIPPAGPAPLCKRLAVQQELMLPPVLPSRPSTRQGVDHNPAGVVHTGSCRRAHGIYHQELRLLPPYTATRHQIKQVLARFVRQLARMLREIGSSGNCCEMQSCVVTLRPASAAQQSTCWMPSRSTRNAAACKYSSANRGRVRTNECRDCVSQQGAN
jgi:hypothetical protein